MTNRAALLKTQKALDHHAAKLRPLVDALLYSLAGSGLTIRWESVRGGANSWRLYVTNDKYTRRFYIGWPHSRWRLAVRNSAHGTIIASLESERDIIRWVASL